MPRTLSPHKLQLNSTSHGNEDDAYSTMHPNGTSTSTTSNTGDSGFEDVRPLQRLDQEPDTKEDTPQPAGKDKIQHT